MRHMTLLKGLGLALVGMALFSGCSTVAVSSEGAMNKDERLLTLQSDGYALIDLIPLCSGTVEVDEKGNPHAAFALFQDRTHSDELYAAAQAIAKAQNCELKNVVFMNNYKAIDTANCYGLLTVYDVALSAVLKAKK